MLVHTVYYACCIVVSNMYVRTYTYIVVYTYVVYHKYVILTGLIALILSFHLLHNIKNMTWKIIILSMSNFIFQLAWKMTCMVVACLLSLSFTVTQS